MSFDESWPLPRTVDRTHVLNAVHRVLERFPGVLLAPSVEDEDLQPFATEPHVDPDGSEDFFLSIPYLVAEQHSDGGFAPASDGPFDCDFSFIAATVASPASLNVLSNSGDNRTCWAALCEIVGDIAQELSPQPAVPLAPLSTAQPDNATFVLPFQMLPLKRIEYAVRKGLEPHRNVQVEETPAPDDDERRKTYVFWVEPTELDPAARAVPRRFEGPYEIELLFRAGEGEQKATLFVDRKRAENHVAWKVVFEVAHSIAAGLGGLLQK